MGIQQIAVIAIVTFCFLFAGMRIYRYFSKIGKDGNPCEGCNSSCSLKEVRSRQKCGERKMKENEEKVTKIVGD